MKAKIIFYLVLTLIIASCTNNKTENIEENNEQVSPIEGVWEVVYFKFVENEPLIWEYPGNIILKQKKIWTSEHFMYTGIFRNDTISMDNFGNGTYQLDGNHYQENIINLKKEGADTFKVKLLLEIKNDTLIQKWPANDNWEIDPVKHNIEKYIRVE